MKREEIMSIAKSADSLVFLEMLEFDPSGEFLEKFSNEILILERQKIAVFVNEYLMGGFPDLVSKIHEGNIE